MELWFILSFLAVFFFSCLVYACLAIFYPEWVGITGKVALDAERSHAKDSEAGEDLIKK